jgi:hypothetical protein
MIQISEDEYDSWCKIDGKIQIKSMELLEEFDKAGLPIDGKSYLEFKKIDGDGNIEYYGEHSSYGGTFDYWYSIPSRCLYDDEYKTEWIQGCFDYIRKQEQTAKERKKQELINSYNRGQKDLEYINKQLQELK